jgi:hypothetical protein
MNGAWNVERPVKNQGQKLEQRMKPFVETKKDGQLDVAATVHQTHQETYGIREQSHFQTKSGI